ncbi:MAG: sigma-54-dependent Fis family transcriptional regulator [Planctomycetaceae bacterium]|nr:sigma-54-dependent Fis family transcriptional regulator [Planctomycetaceae bacterium]
MVYQSPLMQQVLEHARRYAQASAPVLITGESGTGKEVLARYVHEQSPRKDAPYFQINCAALSEQLIESELFGHEAGAFTGASQTRVGRLEGVGSGTLLLDELGELPLVAQAKLLRVLEEREYQRVGSNQTRNTEARMIAATNRCLEDEVEAGRFREDLYHRIHVLALELPPLREHREDIPGLVTTFLRLFQRHGETSVRKVSAQAMKQLCDHDWPGNIRQLKNVLLKNCILTTGEVLDHVILPASQVIGEEDLCIPKELLRFTLEEVERRLILAQLQRHNGNKTVTAEVLGVTARTLRNKMDRYRKLGYVA